MEPCSTDSVYHSTDKSELVVRTRKVQKQTNSVDSGLFALAFATSLLNGINPEEETYSVADLRPLLVDCLQFGKMTKFPIVTRTVFPRVRSTTLKLDLYCHCRMPWRQADTRRTGKRMAECEKCGKWFHQECEDIPELVFKHGAFWTCKSCTRDIST